MSATGTPPSLFTDADGTSQRESLIRTWPAPRPEDEGVSLLAGVFGETARRFGRIGVTMGHETHLRMPAADFAKLRDRLGNLEIADSTDVIRTLRNIKSPSEIEKIRHVCQLTSHAFEALPARTRTGETERAVCRKLRVDLLERGADNSPYLIAASGPGGYDNIIMGPTDRVLENGDVLILDTGTTFDGYFCDFDRNFAFGPPSDEARRAHEVVFKATDVGIAAARPGATSSDLWAEMWAVLEAGGALARIFHEGEGWRICGCGWV